MRRIFYGREYELEEGSDWCKGCAFEKGRRKCHGGGNPPPSKYCRPDRYEGVVLVWKEVGPSEGKAKQSVARALPS